MNYKKIHLFENIKSRGTFEDFFDINKYESLEQAYKANDYVECDFVKDDLGLIHIELKNTRNQDIKKYHELIYQNPVCGLDALDDAKVCEIAVSLF